MNIKNYTTKEAKAQEASEIWSEQIGKILPGNIDEIAKSKGALERKREVKSSTELLKVLLIYAVSTMSIRMLALCASVMNVSEMSDTAWRKKIVNSVLWLTIVLEYILPKPQTKVLPVDGAIYLIDGSSINQEGAKGTVHRIHMNYNLQTSMMEEIKVTDHHTAESIEHHTIRAGGIYIADAGYGKAKSLDYVIKHNADAIFRVSPNHISLYDVNGDKLDTVKLLSTKNKVVDFTCYMQDVKSKKMIPVRIIASKLPEDKQADAIKRKKRKSSKNQSTIKPETLLYAKWVVIATSLDDTYTANKILEIYRCRWQIELLFKRIKQHLKITKIRPASKKYVHALILLWLIIWVVVERQTIMAELCIIQKKMDLTRVSLWTLSSFFFFRVKMIIESVWTTLFDPFENIDLIFKCLQNHKSSRVTQYFLCHLTNFIAINTRLAA